MIIGADIAEGCRNHRHGLPQPEYKKAPPVKKGHAVCMPVKKQLCRFLQTSARETDPEPFQQVVRTDCRSLVDAEWADAAGGMPDHSFRFSRRKHFGFCAERSLVFLVIDLLVSGSDYQNGMSADCERKSLCDPAGLAPGACAANFTVAPDKSISLVMSANPNSAKFFLPFRQI